MLTQEFPSVRESVSLTTRAPRANEVPGEHYHFVTEEDFARRIEEGEFLEHAAVFGAYYGTSRKEVEAQTAQGKHVVLVIDTQGALQLRGTLDEVMIFVSPPSLAELRRRLESRSTEPQDVIEERLSWAEREIAALENYDYHIVNENLQIAYEVLRSIVIAEEHRASAPSDAKE
jgi:guanylate kinase